MSVASSAAITVAICTFNRHHLLRECIEALLAQRINRDLFRILIVDNSPDKGRAESFYEDVGFHSLATIIHSYPPGLSRARNCAAAACGTPYIAYIDDDARPEPDWLAGLLAGFRYSSKVAAVGGPIQPIWKNRPPEWLPPKHLGLLTILEAEGSDRDLPKHQYLYGANMAFRIEQLRAMGGFPEHIGRDGAKSLLSCEETQLQDALREAGYVVRFITSAGVRHMVHEDRLQRNWMRSRMSWQSVSEQLQKPPLFHKDWVLGDIERLVRYNPDAAAAFRLFFKDAKGKALDTQLHAIRVFSALLLGAHSIPEEAVRAVSGSSTASPALAPAVMLEGNEYAPSAAGVSSAKYLFVEALPGHRYLYDLYGDVEGAQLLLYTTDDSAWCNGRGYRIRFKQFLDQLRRSIGRRTRAIFFLTFDGPVYGAGSEEYFEFLQSCRVPVLGILHRLPESDRAIQAARKLASLVAGICFLSETMAERARSEFGFKKAYYLPHHQTSYSLADAIRAREQTRARLGVRPQQVVLGVIGEARKGKGIPWLLSALEEIPPAVRERMFFLFAGKAKDYTNEEVREGLAKSRLTGFTDLRPHPVRNSYAVLSGSEYAKYVAATDIGLLLYQDGQRRCMSGVLGDFLASNCKVLATADSFVGAEVERHHLGLTVQLEDAKTLAAALVASLGAASAPLSQRAEEYRRRTAADAVLEALRALLAECGGAQQVMLQRGPIHQEAWVGSEAAE